MKARSIRVSVDAHSELMAVYPWGETTPSQTTHNLQDTGWRSVGPRQLKRYTDDNIDKPFTERTRWWRPVAGVRLDDRPMRHRVVSTARAAARLVGHASIVQRRLLYDGRALRAGCVEGVLRPADLRLARRGRLVSR